MNPQLFEAFCHHIDWDLPALAPWAKHFNQKRFESAALGVVRQLRQRQQPDLGCPVPWVKQLRSAATPEVLQHANDAWERALTDDLLSPPHYNAFSCMGVQNLILGATESRCVQMSQRLIEQREQWAAGVWGTTQSICDLARWLMPVEACDDAHLVVIFCWLHEQSHAEWRAARTWSDKFLGITGHNWWAHTFWGFWLAGMCFDCFTGFAQFKALAPTYLEREFKLLLASDGWSHEGSPGYHHFALSNLLPFAELARRNDITLAPLVQQRLLATAQSAWKMMMPNGGYALFGDTFRAASVNDSAGHKTLPQTHPVVQLRYLAALYEQGQAKFVAQSLSPAWQPSIPGMLSIEGNNLLHTYENLKPSEPKETDTHLPVSGYYLMRQNWTPQADALAMDASPIGEIGTSHKHPAVFNFELFLAGRPMLVDNGSGGESSLAPRMWRVSSEAHNVVTIDKLDHVPIVKQFRFGAVIHPVVDEWQSSPSFAYFSGAYEGYKDQPDGVPVCRRKLFYLRGEYWILIDHFDAHPDKPHLYEQHFHINAKASLIDQQRVRTHDQDRNLLIVPMTHVSDKATLEDNPYPLDRHENPMHLRYARTAVGQTHFVTLLMPFTGNSLPVVEAQNVDVHCDGRVLAPREATALKITINGRSDIYFDQHMHWNLPWQCQGHQGNGRLFHSQCT